MFNGFYHLLIYNVNMSKKSKQLANKPVSFKATTTYTFEEFVRFGKTISAKRLHTCDLIIVLTYLLIAFFSLLQGNYLALLVYLIIIPIMMIFSRVFLHFGFKRIWKSNKDAENLVTTFTFHLSDFRQKNKLNDLTIRYDNLSQIIETDTNFYLMVNKNQGSLLNKKDCSSELIDFLQQRAKEINKGK